MQVYHLFSKNNKVGSKLISWASKIHKEDHEKEIPSHIAILVQEADGSGMVIESTLFTGVRFIPYQNWLEINTEVAKIKCQSSIEISKNIQKLWGKKYDWYGILYFGYRLILKKLLDMDIPEHNKFERKNSYMCTEFVGVVENIPYQMKTPHMMMSCLSSRDCHN